MELVNPTLTKRDYADQDFLFKCSPQTASFEYIILKIVEVLISRMATSKPRKSFIKGGAMDCRRCSHIIKF